MLSTALLIVLGLVIVGVCVLGLYADRERRIRRELTAPDGLNRERAEALRQISDDIEKGKFYGTGGAV